MLFWYQFLTYLFFPFSSIYLYLRKLKKKEDPFRYKEKLSKINLNREDGFLIWIHVASVGETLSILPLLENLENEEKINKILITSITLSSSEVIKKRLSHNKKVIHQFLPFDVSTYVKKFLNHWKPNMSIFVESEIWPNLINEIKKRNIPLILINGRITKKSFNRWKFFTKFAKKIFEKFDLCIASNKDSEKYLKILGAKNVKNYGNLKFANAKLNFSYKLDQNFLSKILSRKIWCAASTHPTEEYLCAKTHLKLKNTFKNILTIIIPRHIHRINDIVKELKILNLKFVLYSNLNEIENDTDILLVDAYGETSKFFNISKTVFLGGSIVNRGGQNPIEPARTGSKIFYGPNISNFSEIYDYLKSLGLAKQINKPEELALMLTNELVLNEPISNKIINKIDSYGLEILNSVMKEIKIYINT